MADKFRCKVGLPPVTDPDVVSREFTVTVGGVEDRRSLTGAARDTTDIEFVWDQNAVVDLSLVDIDDAGNRSPGSKRQFTVLDTIPPHQPGEISVTVLEEIVTPEAPTP